MHLSPFLKCDLPTATSAVVMVLTFRVLLLYKSIGKTLIRNKLHLIFIFRYMHLQISNKTVKEVLAMLCYIKLSANVEKTTLPSQEN